MTAEHNIENRLRAMSAHTPSPVLDTDRLSKGIEKHQKLLRFTKVITAAAAAIVMIVSAVIITSAIARSRVLSTVTLDSSASITISLNADREVVDISGNDQQGIRALAGFRRTADRPDKATAELIRYLIDNGTLGRYDNTVLATVDSDSDDQKEEIRRMVADAIEDAYGESRFEGAVLSQITDNSKSAEHISARYHVSRGKAQMLCELIDADNTMSYRGLSRMNINDLNLIADSIDMEYSEITESGQSSGMAYLHDDDVIRIVIENLNAEKDSLNIRLRLDARDGELVYRLTVKNGETVYTYNLVATTGEIITVIKSSGSKTEIIVESKSRTATVDDNAHTYTPPVYTPIDRSAGTSAPVDSEVPQTTVGSPTVSPTKATSAPSPLPTQAPTAIPTIAPSAAKDDTEEDDAVPDTVNFTSGDYYRVEADLMTAGFVTETPPEGSEALTFTKLFNGRFYGDNPQKLYTFDHGKAAVICNRKQLLRFLSEYDDDFTDSTGDRFDPSAYSDNYFADHALVITYYALYNMDYDFNVTDMYRYENKLYVNASMSSADNLPKTAYSAHDLLVFEIDRSVLSADTQLNLY